MISKLPQLSEWSKTPLDEHRVAYAYCQPSEDGGRIFEIVEVRRDRFVGHVKDGLSYRATTNSLSRARDVLRELRAQFR
jgi:hypothetical protein